MMSLGSTTMAILVAMMNIWATVLSGLPPSLRAVWLVSSLREGFFTSLPFLCPGGVLELDADARKPITVQVCGSGYADGKAWPGYESKQCEPIVGNNRHHRIRWKTKDNLDELRGRFISLRISGINSVVYGATLRKINTSTGDQGDIMP